MSEQPDPLIGKRIAEYTILDLIGAGGMGKVYRAHHDLLDKDMALKILSNRVADDEQYVQRFLREAKIASSLHHASLVEVFDCGQSEFGYYMVMELVKGMSLGVILASSGKLDEDQVLNVAEATLSALEFAHAAGVIHRDIKPDNLLIQEDGSLKLTDLGLAKASALEDDAGLTQSGMVLGTPFYVSPEQIQGSKNVDLRTDFYSLGATLYHCATGHHPFSGDSSAIIMNKHLNEPPPNPKHRASELSEETAHFILRLMNKNPDYRYANSREAIVAVQHIRNLRQNPDRKAEEVVFLEEPDWKDKAANLIIPILGGIVLIGIIIWLLAKPGSEKKNPVSSVKNKHETAIVVEKKLLSEAKPHEHKKEVRPPEPVEKGKVIPPSTSPVQAAMYRVQLPQVIRDGYFKAGSGDPMELTHADLLPLDGRQMAFFHFDLKAIQNGMNSELGQSPELRRVDLVVAAKTFSSAPDTRLKLFRLLKSPEEGYFPSEQALAEMKVPPVDKIAPISFNVTEDVLRAIKEEKNYGWCVTLEGEGQVALASSQGQQSSMTPGLFFMIGIRPDLVPKKE